MAEIDIAAAYRGIKTALDGAVGVWADRAYAESVPASVANVAIRRPYVIYFYMGGGAARYGGQLDGADLLIGIKCVADSLVAALHGAGQIEAALNDAERHGGLNTGDDWHVTSVTRQSQIILKELIDGRDVWHAGNQYRVRMERN